MKLQQVAGDIGMAWSTHRVVEKSNLAPARHNRSVVHPPLLHKPPLPITGQGLSLVRPDPVSIPNHDLRASVEIVTTDATPESLPLRIGAGPFSVQENLQQGNRHPYGGDKTHRPLDFPWSDRASERARTTRVYFLHGGLVRDREENVHMGHGVRLVPHHERTLPEGAHQPVPAPVGPPARGRARLPWQSAGCSSP